MPKGSVKIMLSYDYCHFEVCLGSDEEKSLQEIDDMRKDAQRLADKAVKQYQIAKKYLSSRIDNESKLKYLEKEVKIIKENFPKSEWNEDQKAKVKEYDNLVYFLTHPEYDYEDDMDIDW